jgi:3,2-trans-enoyl-CoA isomerase
MVLQEMFRRLYGLKIPSAALIGGHAPAGGTLLATACDYRVMISNPKFTIGLNEVRGFLHWNLAIYINEF